MISGKLRRFLSPVLFPVSLVYRCITSVRNKCYDLNILKSTEFELPVISVGNITAGGTGKTPHVEYLLHLLTPKFQVAFLSRGYRRKTKGFVLAGREANPGNIGDEPYQIYKKFSNVRVAVDEDRIHGINRLLEKDPNLSCVVLDDAFQHRRLRAGVSIVLIDYYRPLHKDYILPMGDLRESRFGIHRANIVIVTKVPHKIKPIEKRLWIKELNLFPYQFLYFTSIEYGKLIPVFNSKQKSLKPEELDKKKTKILLVTGIANAKPLAEKLAACCKSFEHISYPDHHEYRLSDIKNLMARYHSIQADEKIIITTEKDAGKLEAMGELVSDLREKMYYLPLKIVFLDQKGKEFDANIHDFVAKNKRISRLHS